MIDGEANSVRTRYRSVEAVLQELNLNLEPEDIVIPARDADLSPGDTLTIRLARPATIEADGQTRQLLTHRQQLTDLFNDIGLKIDSRDEILVNNKKTSLKSLLPPPQPRLLSEAKNRLFAAVTPGGTVAMSRPKRIKLVVHRAVPIVLNEGETTQSFRTTKLTVGEALLEHEVTVYEGDRVTPPLNTPLRSGLNIDIQRATPVAILTDGQVIKTRTHGKTVGEILAAESLPLMGQDFTRPPTDHEILANDVIEIVRVNEVVEIDAEYIPFETQWLADAEMEIDQQEVRQKGITGVIKSRTRVRYENDLEVSRIFEDEWLDQAPETRMIAYGTNVIVRTVDTPEGPIEYWRKIPMLATSYTAATSGKARDHPRYGITRSGLQAGYGIVAVDPKVIPLMSKLYVPNYGVAVAGDTGGAILGKHIDLGFDEGKPIPRVYGWLNVYVLTPVPNPNRIRYVLPQWPQRD